MKGKFFFAVAVTLVGILAFASVVMMLPNFSDSSAIATLNGTGARAQQQAAQKNKFLFLLVYEKDDLKTKTLKQNLEMAVPKLGAHWAAINQNLSEEKAFIRQFKMKSPPAPYVLALAPNGAITGSMPEASEENLRGAMVSPGFQALLKPLQAGKLVLLCLQNSSTRLNAEALRGIEEFKRDDNYAYFVEVVKIDPADPQEKAFLTQLGMNTPPKVATTVFFTPPSAIIGSYTGPVSKKALIDAIKGAAAASSARGKAPNF